MVVSKLISFKSYEKPVVGIEGKVTRGWCWMVAGLGSDSALWMHASDTRDAARHWTLDTLACTDTHLDTHHTAAQALESDIKFYVS